MVSSSIRIMIYVHYHMEYTLQLYIEIHFVRDISSNH